MGLLLLDQRPMSVKSAVHDNLTKHQPRVVDRRRAGRAAEDRRNLQSASRDRGLPISPTFRAFRVFRRPIKEFGVAVGR